MSFQTEVRQYPGVAVPGTIVEAADTYKFVKSGKVADDSTVTVGAFAVSTGSNIYRATATGDTAVAGVVVFDHFKTGETADATYRAGENFKLLANGIVAVNVTADDQTSDGVVVVLATGEIKITSSASDGELLTDWVCVQHTGLDATDAGIAFIKK